MLASLIKRCQWTGKWGRALLLPAMLGLLATALMAGCAGTSAPTAPTLLVFRDGLGNFGLYRGDGPIVALDAKNGHRLWQRALDALPPGTHQVGPLVQPTVQEGLVYTSYTYRDPSKPISLQRAALEALDPATGQLRWRHEVAPNQNTNTDLD